MKFILVELSRKRHELEMIWNLYCFRVYDAFHGFVSE